MTKLSELIEKYGDYEISDDTAEMIKPRRYWVPKLNERYFFITGVGSVSYNNFKNTGQDNFRIEKCNCYKSEREAQFALDMYHFCRERSFEPNWEEENQTRYVLALDFHNHRVCGVSLALKYFAPFYYPTFEQVDEVMNKYTFEELAKYYGRV